MAEIAVTFEKHGKRGQPRIIVQNPCQPVLPNEDINWHFHVRDRIGIDVVEIEFARKSATYFTEEVDHKGRTIKRHTNVQRRDLAAGATIYGRPPHRRFPKTRSNGKGRLVKVPGYVDKYWVRGYKGRKLVAYLDPEIVPIRPPSP